MGGEGTPAPGDGCSKPYILSSIMSEYKSSTFIIFKPGTTIYLESPRKKNEAHIIDNINWQEFVYDMMIQTMTSNKLFKELFKASLPYLGVKLRCFLFKFKE